MTRRNLVGIVGACLALLVSSVAFGQVGVSATAGVWIPVGDAGDWVDTGFTIGGNVHMPIHQNVAVGGRLAYDRAGLSDEAFDPLLELVDDSFSIVEVLGSVRFGKISKEAEGIKPFAQFGAGLMHLKGSIGFFEESTNEFGMVFGGGFDMSYFEMLALFGVAFTEGDSTQYFSITGGVNF